MIETFNEIFREGMSVSYQIALYAFALSSLLFLRPICAYAKAIPLDPDDDGPIAGSFLFVSLFAIAVNVSVHFDKTTSNDDKITWVEFKEHLSYHPAGPFIDMLVAFFLPLAVGLLWPAVILACIFVAPIQYLHVKNAKKREFIERLKGEHKE